MSQTRYLIKKYNMVQYYKGVECSTSILRFFVIDMQKANCKSKSYQEKSHIERVIRYCFINKMYKKTNIYPDILT